MLKNMQQALGPSFYLRLYLEKNMKTCSIPQEVREYSGVYLKLEINDL